MAGFERTMSYAYSAQSALENEKKLPLRIEIDGRNVVSAGIKERFDMEKNNATYVTQLHEKKVQKHYEGLPEAMVSYNKQWCLL